ncbi:unnamed protein product, partial [Ectocarpus sp. 13 AM-2016]
HDAVDQLSFLQNNPPIFVSNLVGALSASYAKPGDVLFYQDEVASDLYFLVTGKVNLFATFSAKVTAEKTFTDGFHCSTMGHTDLQANVIGEGSFAVQTFSFAKVFKDSRIGEAGVMLDVQQPIAAVAMAVCDMFTIGKENLLSALDGFVKVQASLIEDAEDFMRRLDEFKRRKGMEVVPEELDSEDTSGMGGITEKSDNARAGGGGEGSGGGGGGAGGVGFQRGVNMSTARDSDWRERKGVGGASTNAGKGNLPPEGTLPPLKRVSSMAKAAAAAAAAVGGGESVGPLSPAGAPPDAGAGGAELSPASPSPNDGHVRGAHVKIRVCNTIKLSPLVGLDGGLNEGSGMNDTGNNDRGNGGNTGGGGGGADGGGDNFTGGLLVASVSECDSSAFGDEDSGRSGGGESEGSDTTDDEDDAEDELNGSKRHGTLYDPRPRVRSAVSQQYMELENTFASDVTMGGSPAHSSLVQRMAAVGSPEF